jgi:hypothetical protein
VKTQDIQWLLSIGRASNPIQLDMITVPSDKLTLQVMAWKGKERKGKASNTHQLEYKDVSS